MALVLGRPGGGALILADTPQRLRLRSCPAGASPAGFEAQLTRPLLSGKLR